MESGVGFVAVDMPRANRLTIHILAAVAEHDREAISQRIKAAPGAAKRRVTRWGNPRWEHSIESARSARNPVPVVEQNARHPERSEGPSVFVFR